MDYSAPCRLLLAAQNSSAFAYATQQFFERLLLIAELSCKPTAQTSTGVAMDVRDQNSVVQTRFINRPSNSTKSIEPPLTATAFVQKISNCFRDQLIGGLVSTA